MATDPTIQKFITERQEALHTSFKSGNVEELLTWYDDSVEFSDYAYHAINLNKTKMADFYRMILDVSEGWDMVTHGVYGTKEFNVWEWTFNIASTVDDPSKGLEKGKKASYRGNSLVWWKKVDGSKGDGDKDWKIVKETLYAVQL